MQGVVWKSHDFRALSRFISELIQDRAIVSVERQYELVYDLPNGVISNDLEWLEWPSKTSNDIITFIKQKGLTTIHIA